MKLALGIVALAVALVGCGPLDDLAQSTVSITPNVRTDACPANYLRTTPNFCVATPNAFSGAMTLGGACQNIDMTVSFGTPSTATMYLVGVDINVTGLNAIGFRSSSTVFYSDSGCVNAQGGPFVVGVKEFVATANNPIIDVSSFGQPIVAIAGKIYYKANNGGGAASTSTLKLQGYYD